MGAQIDHRRFRMDADELRKRKREYMQRYRAQHREEYNRHHREWKRRKKEEGR